MAWTHFPVARGQRLTAAMLNELRDAIVERGGSIASFSTGQRFTSIQALRDACFSIGKTWYWIESYTGETSHSIHRLTTGATNPSSFPYPDKNIFELAFGDGSTSWRNHGGQHLYAEDLNDIYRVLNVMRVYGASYTTGISNGSMRSLSGTYSTCSAALTAIDNAVWSQDQWVYGYNHVSVGCSVRIDDWSGGQSRGSRRFSYVPPMVIKNVYVRPEVAAFRKWGFSYTGTVREFTFDVRFVAGTWSEPANWAEAQVLGVSVGSVSVPPGHYSGASTGYYAGSVVKAEVNTSQQINLLILAGDMNASGSGLCALLTNPTPRASALEEVSCFSLVGNVLLVEPDYQKLTA